jgi:secretion/DNA translocation related TadE-like protein
VIGRGERGSASIWVLAVSSLLLVVAGVVTVRGLAVLARHRAESAADLAALAAAARIGLGGAPCAAAGPIAAANGAGLRSCAAHLSADGRSGEVLVRVVLRAHLPGVGGREVVASARAGRGGLP